MRKQKDAQGERKRIRPAPVGAFCPAWPNLVWWMPDRLRLAQRTSRIGSIALR